MRVFSNVRLSLWLLATMLLLAPTGCTTIKAVPAGRVPASLLARPRADTEPINLIRLRQDPPAVYQLGPRDILGIYIEGVLPQTSIDNPQPPPVNFPESGTTPPSIGYPIPVREDGTISLPLIQPLRVVGLTLTQAEEMIRDELVRDGILPKGRNRIVVTLMRKRTYQVLVVREDTTGTSEPGSQAGIIRRGAAEAIDLPAYENDVLHALSETGGMPGLDARAEVMILRGAFDDAVGRDALLSDIAKGNYTAIDSNPYIVRIPLRARPDDPPPELKEEDIILTNGDIVYVPTREREVFYTGGLLQGREQLLPRDYDLDVLGAIALANGSVATGINTGQNTGMGSAFGGGLGITLPPTDVLILRTTEDGYQVPIRVRLKKALNNPAERILIQPGDVVILQHTPLESTINILIGNINIPLLINYLKN